MSSPLSVMITGVRMKKNLGKGLLRGAVIVLGLNLVYFLLITAVFLLPVGARVRLNVTQSLYTWQEGRETEGPVFDDNRILWNDTRAEMQMADIAVTEAGAPLLRGISLYWLFLPDEGDPDPVRQYKSLALAVSDPENASLSVESYERYWFLIAGVLRLLYCFLTVGEIRWLLQAAGLLLSVWLFARVFRLLGARGVIPLALAFVSRSLIMNMTYAATAMDVYVAILSMIALTYLYGTAWFRRNRLYYYLVLGSVTFAAGPFISPLLTLGMTLLMEIQLAGKEDKSKDAWAEVVSCSITRVLGYGLTMLCKALISMALVRQSDGFGIAAGYMGAENALTLAERIGRVFYCVERLLMPVQAGALIALLFAMIWIIATVKYGVKWNRSLLLTLAVSLYPVLWVLVVAEHAVHDYAVTIFAVTVYGIAAVCANFTGDGGAKKQKR